MRRDVEFRVISEVDGWVTQRNDRDSAQKVAEHLTEKYGHNHRVEEVAGR
jgi:hypothetical protein